MSPRPDFVELSLPKTPSLLVLRHLRSLAEARVYRSGQSANVNVSLTATLAPVDGSLRPVSVQIKARCPPAAGLVRLGQ